MANEKPKTEAEIRKEAIAKEIARNEEYVEIRLMKDNEKYKDDVYVAVGTENCVIRRGIVTKIKRKFANVLEASMRQDELTAEYISRETEKAKAVD